MLSREQLSPFFEEIYRKTDRAVELVINGYFIFGILLAFFYDTWLVGIGVGMLSLILYYGSKYLFKETTLYQYVASLVLAIFMAQFIYQMHGLFEMHFTAFIAIIAMIPYQNYKVFLPATIFIVVHHAIFAYVQFIGFSQSIESYQTIYFTQMDYMDLPTFIFHAGLVAFGVLLAGFYAVHFRKRTIDIAIKTIALEEGEKLMEVNINFANQIADNNYNTEFELEEGDIMGQALFNMRTNLKESTIRENQEKFSNVGLAKVADIVRNYSNDLNEFSYQTVTFLVKYMKLNQAGMFVVERDNDTDEDELTLKGCYAYERRKYVDKKIGIGQGLVGQCFLEKDVIYLKEVPEDYIKITSGLGQAAPSIVVLVPIKNEDTIEGVIELAGFKELEDYQLKFLSEVGESIAMAIHSTKINQRTNELYQQSQQQTEEMRAQEEEMRQNMEELQATQEEMDRKSKEMSEQIRIVNATMATVEFDLNGIINDANENFLQLMRYSKAEILDKHHKLFVTEKERSSQSYQDFWHKLANGESFDGEFMRLAKGGKEIWIKGMYSPMLGSDGRPVKIVKYAYDITKTKSLELKGQLSEA